MVDDVEIFVDDRPAAIERLEDGLYTTLVEHNDTKLVLASQQGEQPLTEAKLEFDEDQSVDF